jgi:hypothetical protein
MSITCHLKNHFFAKQFACGGTGGPTHISQVPTFGSDIRLILDDHFANDQPKKESFMRVMCVLSRENPDVEYCIGLAEIVALLLLHISEEIVFVFVHRLLKM